jgi:hypothetical protein
MADDSTIVAAARLWSSDRAPHLVERSGIPIVSYCRTRVYLDRDAWEMLPENGVLLMRVEPSDDERFVLAMPAAEVDKVFGEVRTTASWRDARCYHFPHEPPAADAFRVRFGERPPFERRCAPADATTAIEPRTIRARPAYRTDAQGTGGAAPPAEDSGDLNGQASGLGEMTVSGLLALNRATLRELRTRKVVRSSNAPTGDYAEWLVQQLTGGVLAPQSQKSWDVETADGGRVQVKARALTPENASRQLSPIRSWGFDQLAVVLFDDSFSVLRVVFIDCDHARQQGVWRAYVRGWILIARDEFLTLGVDRTDDVRQFER